MDRQACYTCHFTNQAFNTETGFVDNGIVVGRKGVARFMLEVKGVAAHAGVEPEKGANAIVALAQFVVEAVVLSELGGVLGVVTGLAIAQGLAHGVPALKAAVPIWAVILGLGFCSLVGMVFGIYPAIRASRLDPIEALRYE